jgi:hypothetical protein
VSKVNRPLDVLSISWLASNPKIWTAQRMVREPALQQHHTTANPNSPKSATMGRELQKKKNKSSLPKKRQNGPSKKKILQNPIIAKHWYAQPPHIHGPRTDE